MKLVQYWPHAPWAKIYETQVKNFFPSAQKHSRDGEKEKKKGNCKAFCVTYKCKQEVGDNLSVFILIVLLDVCTFPSLVAISLAKVEIYFYQLVT